MKNKILLGGIACLAALVIVSCNKKEETAVKEEVVAVDAEKVKADIQAMETALAESMNAGSANGIDAYYAEDAVSYSQDKPPLTGRAAIKAHTDEQIKESPKGTKVSFTANEVHPSSDGNEVVELGAYKVTDSAGTAMFTGNYMALFKKVDGKYICVRDMAASDMEKKKEEKK